ncbi:MAG: 2-hydroxy-3-oxopropionate reductase [Deltaproteobacteria bacterium]|nr:2-hydroxy-3-oxopropionate reductase [Deltaproteobacteria bacterium]
MIEKIGFIGLGIMGQPMVGHLLKAGYKVAVYDVLESLIEKAVTKGAVRVGSPREAAIDSDVIITMLPDSPIVEKVALGPDGILEGMKEGAVFVDMSTTSITTTKKVAAALAEAGSMALDAPVSGGDVGAIEATLSIMVGGSVEAFHKVLPVLQKMGKNITHVGDNGSGQIAKACNQVVVAITIEAVSESLVFAKKNGADPERIREAMMGGFAQSRVLELHGKRMIERNFTPGGKVRLHKKDIDIVLEEAKKVGVYMPGSAMVSQIWNSLAAMDGLDWDHSSIVKAIELLSQTEL